MIELKPDKLAEEIRSELVEASLAKGGDFAIATVRIGEDPGSVSYEKALGKTSKRLGIDHRPYVFSLEDDQADIVERIQLLNQDSSVSGILVFQPIDRSFDRHRILNAIDPAKDVDGSSDYNIKRLMTYREKRNLPATAVAILDYIESITDIESKDVLIINRSYTIGRPLSIMMVNDNATVTLAHSRTRDVERLFADKDIVVSAVGQAEIFKPDRVKDGAILIDMGISKKGSGYCGDLDLENIKDENFYYMPSMGGIGKITSLVVLRNTIMNRG